MGRNKAALRLERLTLLQHVTKTARRSGLRVRIIRRDLVTRCGPLGGIYTGLFTSSSRAELFLACDMPFVSLGLIRELEKRFAETGQAVFTRVGRRSGFPCLLPRACLPTLSHCLEAGIYSMQSVASELGACFVTIPRGDLAYMLNINTPADFQRAQKRLRTGRVIRAKIDRSRCL